MHLLSSKFTIEQVTAAKFCLMDALSAIVEREKRLIKDYGEFLCVKDIAQIFRYPSPGSVLKAHEAGHLPVKIKKFRNRRGYFATAKAVAVVICEFEEDHQEEKRGN